MEHQSRLIILLEESQKLCGLWKEHSAKILAQLRSIGNLVEQLEALESCSRRKSLGALSGIPLLVEKLQAKILSSMERAHDFISRDRKAMGQVVDLVRTKSVQAEKEHRKITQKKGLEFSMERSEVSFSPADHVYWIQQTASAVVTDWQAKKTALKSLKYTKESVRGICEIWSREVKLSDIQDSIDYTLTRHAMI